MENPTFRLEGIVREKEELEDFEGPLTLILQLLSKNKIAIRDIKISELLDQYLEYLEEMKSMDLEIASEFVAMASHLVYIKAKSVVDGDETNEELEQLISSLENLKSRDTYVLIKTVLPEFGDLYKRGGGYIVKPAEYFAIDSEYDYVHDKKDIIDAIGRVFSREEAYMAARSSKPFDIPHRIVYSVSEKTEEILTKLRDLGTIRGAEYMRACKSRTELVATFIAILELVKTGGVLISGEGDDFIISKANDAEITEKDGEEQDGNS